MTARPADLHRAVEAARTLRFEIAKLVQRGDEGAELTDDDLRAIQDSFDGETTLEVELEAAIIAEDDDLILVDGLKTRIAVLKSRLDRIEDRIESRRGLIEAALLVAGWTKHELGIATVSLSKKPPSVVIDEESEIPTQFFKRADPVLDKAGLNRLLKERHKALIEATKIADQDLRAKRMQQIDAELPPIPGAHLEADQVSLTIRRK